MKKKPWKQVKYCYKKGSYDEDLIPQAEQLTKRFAFKKINKIIFSSDYRDLIIGVKSGETLTIKNYFCPSCAQINYNQQQITQMYEDALLGLTCCTIIMRRITFDPTEEEVFDLLIEGLHNRREKICGFYGPIFIRVLSHLLAKVNKRRNSGRFWT